MLPNEVINHMDVDELRAYMMHEQRVEEAHGDRMFAQGEIIDLLQRLYNSQEYLNNCRKKHDTKLMELREFEREMARKYEEWMPRPTCGVTAG